MSAEVELLREAARLMREQANKAISVPGERWAVDVSADNGLIVGSYAPGDVDDDGTRSTACLAFFAYPGDEEQRTYSEAFSVATHMASWDPTTVLAVAGLLDTFAEYDWSDERHRAVLAIARAVLRREA